MKKTMIAAAFLLAFPCVPALADDLPAPIQAALLTKVLEQDTKLSGAEISITVVGNKDVADQLEQLKAKGVKVKGADITVSSAASVKGLSGKCNVLYLASAGDTAEAVKYAEANKILLASGKNAEDAVKAGAAIGFSLSEGKPKILLNPAAMVKQGQEFEAQLLTLATIVK